MQKTTWYKQKKKPEEEKEKGSGKKGREAEREKPEIQGRTKVKAVMFVTQTKGSILAKKLRENQLEMEKMTGRRMKIVERAGEKIEDILHQSNPWSGADCRRKGCLL